MRWFESSHPIQADVVQRRECDYAKVEAEGSSPPHPLQSFEVRRDSSVGRAPLS